MIKMKWPKIRLANIIKVNQNTYSSKENWQFFNYLDTGNITTNIIDDIKYINPFIDKLPSRAKRKVRINSIVYSTVRPNQLHYGIMKEFPENFLVSTGFAVIDVNTEEALPDYIYYVLTQKDIIEHLEAIAEQSVSAYPSIKPSDIENLEIFIPDIDTQTKIVKIISVIDEKIKKNREINNNLEQQVLALYQHNFIDTINELRKNCKMEEYFDVSIGKTPPRKEPRWFSNNLQDITWISISDMGNSGLYISNSSEQLTREAIEHHNIKIVPDNTVLLSFKLTVGRIAITDGEATTNEAIAHFKTNQKEINEYLYCYLKHFKFETMGSTSSIATAINSKIIKSMLFIVPTDIELDNFHNIVGPIFRKIKDNLIEISNLNYLRDTLLPKLMSGEIDVSEINI